MTREQKRKKSKLYEFKKTMHIRESADDQGFLENLNKVK